MKEQDLRVIRREQDENFIIIDANLIEEVDLCETYDSYGNLVGHYGAGDYSLLNSESEMREEMVKEGVKLFGESFEDIEYYESNTVIYAENLDVIDLEDLEEEINEFLNNYELKHSIYNKASVINYWNGSNNMSEPINEDDFVDEETEGEILAAYQRAEFGLSAAAGYREAEQDGYRFIETTYPKFYQAYAE